MPDPAIPMAEQAHSAYSSPYQSPYRKAALPRKPPKIMELKIVVVFLVIAAVLVLGQGYRSALVSAQAKSTD